MDKFKDKMNRWRTRSLFKEFSTDPESVLFTLDEARALFIECEDVTGYTFSQEHLGGWKHWLAIRKSPQLSAAIDEWIDELEVKLRVRGVKNLIRIAGSDKGMQAARYLADAGWRDKTQGRPTKEKIQKEARAMNREYEEFEDAPDLQKH